MIPQKGIMKILPSDVPSIRDAKLPAGYQAAKQALAKCSRIDECAEWSRKADAIASYAKQANDKSLEKMALRIRARAIRRCGELLRKIKPARGEHMKGVGGDPSRKATATQAGLSERQRKTALRVANVPEDEFEAAVEGGSPATVKKLAERCITELIGATAAASPSMTANGFRVCAERVSRRRRSPRNGPSRFCNRPKGL